MVWGPRVRSPEPSMSLAMGASMEGAQDLKSTLEHSVNLRWVEDSRPHCPESMDLVTCKRFVSVLRQTNIPFAFTFRTRTGTGTGVGHPHKNCC
ncbi:hypothetical protein Mapa_014577 [Marchantia paleacea]|nr:hypothetical protein Mapa_014577 [Marchantia paleacea]